jgi:hypothetical protein
VILYRIDPTTNTLAETIDVGRGKQLDVWADERGVWVLASEGPDQLVLYHVDPATHEVIGRTEIAAGWSQTVFGAGGSIWVHASTRGDAPAETRFWIDPTTHDIIDKILPTNGDSFVVTPSESLLWFWHDGFEAMDAVSGELAVGPVDVPASDYPSPCCPGAVVPDGEGGIWVVRVPAVT